MLVWSIELLCYISACGAMVGAVSTRCVEASGVLWSDDADAEAQAKCGAGRLNRHLNPPDTITIRLLINSTSRPEQGHIQRQW